MRKPASKPLHAVGSALDDLTQMPERIRRTFGSALRYAQNGGHPAEARPFGEGLPREILKLVEDYDGDTYRAAYSASFPECVYLLHVFKKKSRTGRATPRPDLATIRARWKMARDHYQRTYGELHER